MPGSGASSKLARFLLVVALALTAALVALTFTSAQSQSMEYATKRPAAADDDDEPHKRLPRAKQGDDDDSAPLRPVQQQSAAKPKSRSHALAYREGYGPNTLPASSYNDTLAVLRGRCPAKFTDTLLEYAAFHREGRAALSRGQFVPTVVFACANTWDCGGLADRMAGFMTVFLFALRYKRVFLSQWSAPHAWFQSPFLDITIDPSWREAENMNQPPSEFGMLMSCEHQDTVIYPACVFSLEDPEARYPATKHHRLISNRGPYSVSHRAVHMTWMDELMGREPGCMYWAMVQPTQASLDAAAPTLARMAAHPVVFGLHFRSGDYAMLERSGNVLDFNHAMINGTLQALDDCLYQRTHIPVFVVSDSLAFRKFVTDRFSGGFTTDMVPMHINPPDAQLDVMDFDKAMRNAFVEWYLLSRCTRTLFLFASGFARLSHVYSIPQRQRIQSDTFGPNCVVESVYQSLTKLDFAFNAGY